MYEEITVKLCPLQKLCQHYGRYDLGDRIVRWCVKSLLTVRNSQTDIWNRSLTFKINNYGMHFSIAKVFFIW